MKFYTIKNLKHPRHMYLSDVPGQVTLFETESLAKEFHADKMRECTLLYGDWINDHDSDFQIIAVNLTEK